MNQGVRPSDIEVLDRREEVRKLLLEEGWTPRARAKLCEHYGVGDQTLRNDKRFVEADLYEGTDKDGNEYRRRLVARQRHISHLSIVSGDYGVAVAATREEAKLMGAYRPERLEVEHSGSVDVVVRTPEEKARSILRALPLACKVLGIDAPVIDVPLLEVVEVEAKS